MLSGNLMLTSDSQLFYPLGPSYMSSGSLRCAKVLPFSGVESVADALVVVTACQVAIDLETFQRPHLQQVLPAHSCR